MTQSSTSTISTPPSSSEPPRSGRPVRPRASESPPDLPGCAPFLMAEDEAATCEGRIDAWDARTRTAWSVREPTTIYHKQPSGRLGRLAERIASVRGAPVECFGSADLRGVADEDVVEALLRSEDEADFRTWFERLRRPGRPATAASRAPEFSLQRKGCEPPGDDRTRIHGANPSPPRGSAAGLLRWTGTSG